MKHYSPTKFIVINYNDSINPKFEKFLNYQIINSDLYLENKTAYLLGPSPESYVSRVGHKALVIIKGSKYGIARLSISD